MKKPLLFPLFASIIEAEMTFVTILRGKAENSLKKTLRFFKSNFSFALYDNAIKSDEERSDAHGTGSLRTD